MGTYKITLDDLWRNMILYFSVLIRITKLFQLYLEFCYSCHKCVFLVPVNYYGKNEVVNKHYLSRLKVVNEIKSISSSVHPIMKENSKRVNRELINAASYSYNTISVVYILSEQTSSW